MRVTGDFAKLSQLTSGLGRFAQETKRGALSRELGEKSLELVREGFERSRDPEGRPWKATKSGSPLRKTRRLQLSWRVRHGRNVFALYSTLSYAEVHQDGATIKAKGAKVLRFRAGNRWASAKEVKIPARPMIPVFGRFPLAWKNDLDRISERFLEKHLGGV